ncbi:hypothetical protein GOP47_0022507 [Adiantum capillus-veneris]|uniref:Uncharacterized protein n=1 Tax=Adiantum capillus-veneris TaxID=13818 RepID=A0A9D4U6M2_ADICA|nr:hypothetical protein GOP47_0022507 [Adiantum capillus-veneris]
MRFEWWAMAQIMPSGEFHIQETRKSPLDHQLPAFMTYVALIIYSSPKDCSLKHCRRRCDICWPLFF